MTVDELLEQRIFEPLRMRGTSATCRGRATWTPIQILPREGLTFGSEFKTPAYQVIAY